ncbi:unnamed protein product [Gongylonema pulchrum]|uniref:ShKT domain-containing protein n=1 Tax=Gongylonema pulchrum TaxID=637853 RepID=A0A183EM39_9BILA|nr:unnamed protein product [Gongylonema pulchrum]
MYIYTYIYIYIYTYIYICKPNATIAGIPFHMDCSRETDEFSKTNCSDWAAAGYCMTNNATRFLWCRKTCLCLGPPIKP